MHAHLLSHYDFLSHYLFFFSKLILLYSLLLPKMGFHSYFYQKGVFFFIVGILLIFCTKNLPSLRCYTTSAEDTCQLPPRLKMTKLVAQLIQCMFGPGREHAVPRSVCLSVSVSREGICCKSGLLRHTHTVTRNTHSIKHRCGYLSWLFFYKWAPLCSAVKAAGRAAVMTLQNQSAVTHTDTHTFRIKYTRIMEEQTHAQSHA